MSNSNYFEGDLWKISKLNTMVTEPIIGRVSDKLIHFTMSAVGTLLLALFMSNTKAFLYVFSLGIAVEIVECIRYISIENTSAFMRDKIDFTDIAVNTVGILLVIGIKLLI